MFLHLLLFPTKIWVSFLFVLFPTFKMPSQLFLVIKLCFINRQNIFPYSFLLLFFLFL